MASNPPIFRTVQVGTGQEITLGAPIAPDVMKLLEPAGPDRYQMRPGTYHRAEFITVQVGPSANVQGMDFIYDVGTSYDGLREEYISELGQPASEDAVGRTTFWQDPRTSFELYAQGSGDRVGSTLQDLANAPAS